MRISRLLAPVVVALSSTACGAGVAARPASTVVLEETRLVASRDAGGELSVDAYTAEDLFHGGNDLVASGDCASAVALYDRVPREFASSRFVSPALYNAGLCLERDGDLPAAIVRFQELVRLLPGSGDVRHARLIMAGALIRLSRWEEALAEADALLTRDDLDESERLESLARRAQALFGLHRLDDAEAAARSTIAYFRVHRDALPDEHFAAAGQFVMAETLRARAEEIAIPAADALTQHAALERRASLLLDAQRAYYDTIRLTDAYWASASGFRVGAMYESLWQAVLDAPVPPPPREYGDEALLEAYRVQFRETLAARVRPLVRHAIHYWELTLMMVERTGVSGEWVERTRAELERARSVLLGGSATAREGAGALADPRLRPDASGSGTPPEPSPPGDTAVDALAADPRAPAVAP